MLGEFNFGDWMTKLALDSAEATRHKGIVFKYNDEFYQDVNNFCDNYDGLKNRHSNARADVVNTDFPISTYLLIPGRSSNNYKHIPEDWKNGTQDLSDLQGAAYIVGLKSPEPEATAAEAPVPVRSL